MKEERKKDQISINENNFGEEKRALNIFFFFHSFCRKTNEKFMSFSVSFYFTLIVLFRCDYLTYHEYVLARYTDIAQVSSYFIAAYYTKQF